MEMEQWDLSTCREVRRSAAKKKQKQKKKKKKKKQKKKKKTTKKNRKKQQKKQKKKTQKKKSSKKKQQTRTVVEPIMDTGRPGIAPDERSKACFDPGYFYIAIRGDIPSTYRARRGSRHTWPYNSMAIYSGRPMDGSILRGARRRPCGGDGRGLARRLTVGPCPSGCLIFPEQKTFLRALFSFFLRGLNFLKGSP